MQPQASNSATRPAQTSLRCRRRTCRHSLRITAALAIAAAACAACAVLHPPAQRHPSAAWSAHPAAPPSPPPAATAPDLSTLLPVSPAQLEAAAALTDRVAARHAPTATTRPPPPSSPGSAPWSPASSTASSPAWP